MEYPFKDLMPLDEVLAREGYYKDWTHLDPEVFYSLTQISNFIKTKGYGVDVRLLIAQLAEHFGLKTTQVVDLANLLQQKFTNLEGVTQSFTNNINSLVAQMEADKDAVIANAIVDSEVILARGGKPTLQARLDDTTAQLTQIAINVTTLGVKLNNINNSAIIQSIIDSHASGGLTLFFPKGEYLLTETITLKKNIQILGAGIDRTIFYTDKKIDNFFKGDYEHKNLSFKDFTLRGYGDENILERGIFLLGTAENPDVLIENCKFSNLNVAIQTGNQGVTIKNNYFENIRGISAYGQAILCVSAKNVIVINNFFKNVKRHCVYFSAGTESSSFTGNVCLASGGHPIRINSHLYEGHSANKNIIIKSNTIDGVSPYLNQVIDSDTIIGGMALSGLMENIVIADNIITNVYNSFVYLNSVPDYDGPFKNVTISNNIMKKSEVPASKIVVVGGENILIHNNIIDDIVSGYGISLSKVKNGTIEGNAIDFCASLT